MTSPVNSTSTGNSYDNNVLKVGCSEADAIKFYQAHRPIGQVVPAHLSSIYEINNLRYNHLRAAAKSYYSFKPWVIGCYR